MPNIEIKWIKNINISTSQMINVLINFLLPDFQLPEISHCQIKASSL